MFGSDKNNADEIGRLWQRLVPLEELIVKQDKLIEDQSNKIKDLEEKIKQPSESKEIAQSAARSAAQHKSKIKKIKEEAEITLNNLQLIQQENRLILEKSQLQFDEANKVITAFHSRFEEGEQLFNDVSLKHEEVISKISETIDLLNQNEDLESQLENANEQLDSIKEIDSKATGILKNITSYHSKVRELRDEILGYDSENDLGEQERIEGIKDELESAYLDLKNNLNSLEDNIQNLKSQTEDSYSNFMELSNEKFNNSIEKQTSQFDEVYQRIVKLLPAALTTGLSAAYNDKVVTESAELDNHKTSFSKAIKWLVAISTIPFIVDFYLLIILKQDLLTVISETPKLVLSILPLYFPILWSAYSANKKINLSKRLIEEYTHKGVLSKTFEGLSTQIEELGDNETSNELKVKLLFNLLHVNSENPGKLISNYKTTDHPLMDALDKSVQLGDAIEKLKNIPGFSKLTAKLEGEAESKLKEADIKATAALDSIVPTKNA